MQREPDTFGRGLRKLAGCGETDDPETIAASVLLAETLLRWRRTLK